MTREEAAEALKALLWELPYELSHDDPDVKPINRHFSVIKGASGRKVHRALWDLQKYFEIKE